MRTSEAATWYSTSRIVTSSLKNEDPARAPVDLVAWGKELDEIRDLQGEPEQRSDAMLWLEGRLFRAVSNLLRPSE